MQEFDAGLVCAAGFVEVAFGEMDAHECSVGAFAQPVGSQGAQGHVDGETKLAVGSELFGDPFQEVQA